MDATGTVMIEADDPLRADVLALLEEHLDDMYATSPAESVHALDPQALRAPDMAFWTARRDGVLLGCVALKSHPAGLVELKSMRTTSTARRQGIAALMLAHVLDEARALGASRISLETGVEDYFAPARALYGAHGFTPCAPFADYLPDPNSVFLTRTLP